MKLLILLSFFGLAISRDNIYTIKFKAEDLQKHFSKLNAIEGFIKQSDMSYQKAIFCINAIDSLEIEIYSQLPDSIKKK